MFCSSLELKKSVNLSLSPSYVPHVLPSPPCRMPPKLAINQAEHASSELDANNHPAIKEVSKMVPPPPPPPRQQPPVLGPAMVQVLQADVLPLEYHVSLHRYLQTLGHPHLPVDFLVKLFLLE